MADRDPRLFPFFDCGFDVPRVVDRVPFEHGTSLPPPDVHDVDSATPALRNSRAADLQKSCRIDPAYLSFGEPHSHVFPVTVF
jgi:hypothetical protein